MESLFRTDLSQVRIVPATAPLPLAAQAVTQGNHIFLAPGQPGPLQPRGLGVLAHELTHVVQQRQGRVQAPGGRGWFLVRDPGLDAEALRMAALATSRSGLRRSTGLFLPFGRGRAVAQLAPRVVQRSSDGPSFNSDLSSLEQQIAAGSPWVWGYCGNTSSLAADLAAGLHLPDVWLTESLTYAQGFVQTRKNKGQPASLFAIGIDLTIAKTWLNLGKIKVHPPRAGEYDRNRYSVPAKLLTDALSLNKVRIEQQ